MYFFVVNEKVDKLLRTKTILPGSKYSSSELATSTSTSCPGAE